LEKPVALLSVIFYSAAASPIFLYYVSQSAASRRGMSNMFRSDHAHKAPPPIEPPKRWSGLIKMAGAVGAVISFLLVINQATGVLQGFRIHHKEYWEAMQIGEQAQDRQDYPAAFASYKHAVELDPIDRKAQEKETKAAMLWLENVHATEKHSFTDTVDQLLPVLDRSLASAKGSAEADVLAHIGWANFLRYREGNREGVDVDGSLNRAVGIDRFNPYANAMLGHWTLWRGGTVDKANQYFAAALASGRERAYVRGLQLAALNNSHKDDSDRATLLVANEMRKDGEPMSSDERALVLSNVFKVRLWSHDQLVAMLSALPPPDAEATVNWLSNGATDIWSKEGDAREYVLANLREIAGDRAEALVLYQALQKDMAGQHRSLAPQVDEAIKRLSAKSK
jgi:hypothetical protein